MTNYDKSLTDPLITVKHDDTLPISIATSVSYQEKRKGNNPSRLLSLSNIYVPDDQDEWGIYDMRKKHDFSFVPRTLKQEESKLVFQMSILEDLLKSIPESSPVIRPLDPRDWVFSFMAQLSLAAENFGMTPKEVLRIFCIKYEGPSINSWDEFKWREVLEANWITVSLRGGRDHERLQ